VEGDRYLNEHVRENEVEKEYVRVSVSVKG
jgi:hypothetical protein